MLKIFSSLCLRTVSGLLLVLGLTLSAVALAESQVDNSAPLTIAVAANFSAPMKLLASEFEQQTGRPVRLSIASSGKLFAQIQHGAPFDVFLSADQDKPQRLVEQGLAVSGSQFTYAVGELALWSSQQHIDPEQTLRQGNFRKLAIANPKLAPYGLAAEQALVSLDLTEASKSKIIFGESIGQAFQFVASGSAELGFVARAQVIAAGSSDSLSKGSVWFLPNNLYAPIRQDAVLLVRAKTDSGAGQFLEFLQSEYAKNTIQNFGYGSVSVDAKGSQ